MDWTFPFKMLMASRTSGVGPPGPSLPLSLAHHTGGCKVGKSRNEPLLMPHQSTKCVDLGVGLGHWEFLHGLHIISAQQNAPP